MANIRKEETIPWQSTSQTPIYLDSAYKQLLRQEQKAIALKNRTRALNINQEHILKQVENNHSTLEKLNQVKSIHAQDSQLLSRDKQKKSQMTSELKNANQLKRKSHERQMSSIALAKVEQRDKIRGQAKKMRKENQRLIEENREQQQSKKRQVRNKIHDDIMESRSTIKNFFTSKHEKIVISNQQEIKKINQKRLKQEQFTLNHSGKLVEELQNQMKEMKTTLRDSRLGVGIELARQQSRLQIKKKEVHDSHPLVRKIETVMNVYTKLL